MLLVKQVSVHVISEAASGPKAVVRQQPRGARGAPPGAAVDRAAAEQRPSPLPATLTQTGHRDRKQSGVTWGGGVSRKLFGEDRVSTGEDRKCCGWPVVVAAHLRIGFTSLSCALENG